MPTYCNANLIYCISVKYVRFSHTAAQMGLPKSAGMFKTCRKTDSVTTKATPQDQKESVAVRVSVSVLK